MDYHKVYLTENAGETTEIGRKFGTALFWEIIKRQSDRPLVVCLYGSLGSGKSTFVRGLARGLGINSRILSPTFVIVREYQLSGLPGKLYHLDLYRIKSAGELSAIGLGDILGSQKSVVVIEWAERIGNSALPKIRYDIFFKSLSDKKHSLEAVPIGESYSESIFSF